MKFDHCALELAFIERVRHELVGFSGLQALLNGRLERRAQHLHIERGSGGFNASPVNQKDPGFKIELRIGQHPTVNERDGAIDDLNPTLWRGGMT